MKRLICFNVSDAYIASIDNLSKRLGFEVIRVSAADFSQSLGYLAKIDGFNKKKVLAAVPSFGDEMIILSGFDSDAVDEFLAEYRADGIKPIELKAGLTPTNIFWDAHTLYKELTRERDEINGIQ